MPEKWKKTWNFTGKYDTLNLDKTYDFPLEREAGGGPPQKERVRMKKRSALLALLALLMLLVLTGCGAPSAADAAERGSSEQETLGAALVEEEPRPLTQMEVLSAYERAMTAYGWFELAPLPCGPEQEIVDGRLYRKVDYPGIEDMADLRTYLRVVFSPELTERLLEQGDYPVYRDVDGALYAFDGTGPGRDRDSGKGAVEISVEQESEGAYSVEVSVELLDSARNAVIGVETYSFPYEFVEGSWVFTDFQMVY